MRNTNAFQRWLVRIGVLLVVTAGAAAQVQKPEPQPGAESSVAHPVDIDDLMGECQRNVRGKEHVGFVWWIPVEFWEASAAGSGKSSAQIAQQFKPLREYTLVAVAVGRISGLGSVTWTPAANIRANVVLRGADGTEYRALDKEKVNADAQLLAVILRPVLSNIIGSVGENTEFLFFPSRGQDGSPLAIPQSQGSFAVVMKDLAGPGETIYEWKTPLTALSPPKFCPTGKERVQANWKYCPWHGTPLP